MEWYIWVIIAISALLLEAGIWWLIDTISLAREKKKEFEKEKSLPHLSREEKIALLKYDWLEQDSKNLLRLYYNADQTKRIIFLRHKDYVTVIKEKLCLFDEEELYWASCYGIWEGDGDGFSHVYDSEETALKEWQKEMEWDGYQEEPLPWISAEN